MVVNTWCVTTKELARIAETAGSSKAITTTVTTAIHIRDTTKAPVYTFLLYHIFFNSSR